MSTQPQLSPLKLLGQNVQKQAQPPQTTPSNLSPLELLGQDVQKQQQQQAPASSTEDQASQTRQMLVSGLTGLPTPNMTDADKASFARGKAAGAISVPVVAGATLGATAAPELLTSIVDKAKAVAQWAKANPINLW